MAANYIAPGDVVALVATETTLSGDGVLNGLLFGIAMHDADNAAVVQCKTTGVWELPKVSAQAWTLGAQIYWDDGNDRCTTVDNNVPIGTAYAVADNPSAVGQVRLTGQVVGTAMVGT
jgi:predicted RecA/RadA family phage recombinase